MKTRAILVIVVFLFVTRNLYKEFRLLRYLIFASIRFTKIQWQYYNTKKNEEKLHQGLTFCRFLRSSATGGLPQETSP